MSFIDLNHVAEFWRVVFIVGNPNRKKMHIFGFVGIFEYILKTTFNIIFSMYTKPKGWMPSLN